MFTGADEHDGPETAVNARECVCVCVCVQVRKRCYVYGKSKKQQQQQKNPAKRNNLGGPK